MADLTITASQVLKGSGADTRTRRAIAGATLTAGQALYLDPAESFTAKGAASSSESRAAFAGISLHGATQGQPVVYQWAGTVTLGAGAAPAAGQVYVVSPNAGGGIAPESDLGTGAYVTVIGVGDGSGGLVLVPVPHGRSGVAHA